MFIFVPLFCLPTITSFLLFPVFSFSLFYPNPLLELTLAKAQNGQPVFGHEIRCSRHRVAASRARSCGMPRNLKTSSIDRQTERAREEDYVSIQKQNESRHLAGNVKTFAAASRCAGWSCRPAFGSRRHRHRQRARGPAVPAHPAMEARSARRR